MKDDEMRDDAPRSGRAQAVKAAIADGSLKQEELDEVVDRIVDLVLKSKATLENAKDECLFSAYLGNRDPKHWREREYYPLLDALKIPRHTPHGTRRTTATMAVEAKVDPAALQKVGGWREFDTIQRHYNKPDVKYLYQEMEKLEIARDERKRDADSAKNVPRKSARSVEKGYLCPVIHKKATFQQKRIFCPFVRVREEKISVPLHRKD